MKKYLIIISTIALTAFCSCSKSDGDPMTKEFNVDGTDTALDVDDAFDVTVSDAVSQVTVTAGDRIMPKVRVEISGAELKIYLKGWTVSHGDMKVLLPRNANLKKVDLSGASNFHGDLVADEVELEISGASDFYGSVMATKLDVDMSGASKATIDGQVGTLKVDVSGSSSIAQKVVNNRYSLACDLCEGEISGASDVYIHCEGSIKVDISGASDLHFTGTAYTYDSHTSGGSNIVHDEF